MKLTKLIIVIFILIIANNAFCQSRFIHNYNLTIVLNDTIYLTKSKFQLVRYFKNTRELIPGTYLPGSFNVPIDPFFRINSNSTDSVFLELTVNKSDTVKQYRIQYNKEWPSAQYNILYIYDKAGLSYKMFTDKLNSHLIKVY